MAIRAGFFVFFTQDFRYVALIDLGLISKWNHFFGLRPKGESCAVERLGGPINSVKRGSDSDRRKRVMRDDYEEWTAATR